MLRWRIRPGPRAGLGRAAEGGRRRLCAHNNHEFRIAPVVTGIKGLPATGLAGEQEAAHQEALVCGSGRSRPGGAGRGILGFFLTEGY